MTRNSDIFYISCVFMPIQIPVEEICRLCTKMQLGPAEAVELEGQQAVKVTVPPTRSDVLHAVDVIEDVGIAYGFNK